MNGGILVLLPARMAHLAARVLQAGCIPVIDATGATNPVVPDGAWVRTRPGRPAPGTGPVLLAELGAPVPDRPTWLESAAPRAIPTGFAGMVLKGREAGGLCGTEDGLVALAQCPEPGRVIVDAGLGPDTAAAAAALGAAGVLVAETHLACPELDLEPRLLRRLQLSDEELTTVIHGIRVANSPTAPVLRQWLQGGDPWALADGLYASGDPQQHLWMVGQGLALAAELAARHRNLTGLLAAYVDAWTTWEERVRGATAAPLNTRVAGTAAGLLPDGAAGVGGVVGSGVLWQEARFLRRPVAGGSLVAAMATGGPVVAEADVVAAAAGVETPIEPDPEPVLTYQERPPESRPAIAIVGLGCLFPGQAHTIDAFWKNVVEGRDCITNVPRERWDPALYFDEDRSAPDRTYTQIGGFLEDFVFEPKRFRIPPRVASQVDPVQQITLTAVANALEDANLQLDKRDKTGRPFDRERCAVILGNSLGGEVSDLYAMRLAWPDIERQLLASPSFESLPPEHRDRVLGELQKRFLHELPEIDEDSMPGELANVIAGRITNAFDLGGANYTVDAACASSMAAIDNACKALQNGDADLAITGGADRSMNIATYVKFCKIGALSPDHSSPFDASANGFVMGEGAGILVLRRYEDAVAAGDKIYAVIRGVGASSDGKGKGITAPNIKGQIRALERAYEAAGLEPWDVDLVEAHGTSTVVGDKVEVEALSHVIGSGKRGERGPIRVGSVKSMIGHLKSAAGAASCIKTALALHHGVFPPSINYKGSLPGVTLGTIPLQVQTHAEPWPTPASGVRRAGVSAFGFGGTNFHVVMEGYAGRELPRSVPMSPPVAQVVPSRPAPSAPAPIAAVPAPPRTAPPAAASTPIPAGIWATSGADRDELIARLEAIEAGQTVPFEPASPMRIAAAYMNEEEKASQLARTLKTLRKGSSPDMLRGRGIHVEEGPVDGKVALLFTGQGSQYADMGMDLAAVFPLVAETFAEADRIVAPTLGRPITDFIRLSAGDDKAEKEAVLKRTEYSQPATLTLDVAILRLLSSFGVQPDMVAGHSLGEYGAAVAAGVLTFEQALLAVSARGREMANIRLDDPGKMAGVATNTATVEEVLAEVDGYVIAANKNCPSQTVIAGASDAVDEAVERFKARGITVHPLPVSHAFHSKIVAPASEPLKGVLTKLGPKAPVRPITTNVTGDWYPTEPSAIVRLLAEQIWSPVEWVAQMERMYEDGARVFVECGPKRALAGFAVAILKRRPHRAVYTNHPKHGGVKSFMDALAALLAAGMPIRPEPGPVDLFGPVEPRRSTTAAITAGTQRREAQPPAAAAPDDVASAILQIIAGQTGYSTDELDLDYELEADLGIDTVKQAEVFAAVRETFQIPEDADFDPAANKTLRSLIEWAAAQMGVSSYASNPVARPSAPTVGPTPVSTPAPGTSTPLIDPSAVTAFLESAAEAGLSGAGPEAFAHALLPAVQGLLSAAWEANQMNLAPFTRQLHEVVCSGASIGLPGGSAVFEDANLVSILKGDNHIDALDARSQLFLEKGIVRLVKDPATGQGSFLPVENIDQVIRLAGVRKQFDLSEWGLDANQIRTFDITTQLAVAAGLEALRDAGIPLVRATRTSASGKAVPGPWQLPAELQDSTGVIFASAFPGYDQMVEKMGTNGDDGEGRFDRRFLFQVLAMGHSQFAQLLGARGPNTAVNAACASTTQAVAIAEDWIRLGRCERVLVLGADDVTSEQMLPWIGSGFMAAGAASTADKVEEAALPFDARRHGLILGMGAVGMVLERSDLPARRGVNALATLVSSRILNSAFHGSRLDVDHIATAMKQMVDEACKTERITPEAMARGAFFMSHETYTPARGGSAAAEIRSLRDAFGAASSEITIANTKGFTGHAMGAGIEDGVAVKSLQYGVVPPLANLREPDPELGELRLSEGEIRDFRYAIRLAAGFGSQLALSIWRREASGDQRIVDPAARSAWLRSLVGGGAAQELVEHRTLRVKAGTSDSRVDLAPNPSPASLRVSDFVRPSGSYSRSTSSVSPAAAPVAPTPAPSVPAVPAAPPASSSASGDSVLTELVAIIAAKTGYAPEELEVDFELEADLGIDTVKQAEVLSDLTDRYGLEQDEDFRLSDHPTIEALAAYVEGRRGATTATVAPSLAAAVVAAAAPTPAPVETPPAPVEAAPTATSAGAPSPEDVTATLLAVVAEKTGYDIEELELDFELEADLGIDTVKQAEVLSDLTDRYGLEQDEDFRLSDHPTIEALAAYVSSRIPVGPREVPAPDASAPAAPVASAASPAPVVTPAPAVTPTTASAPPAAAQPEGAILDVLLAIVSEKTGYEVEELELDFELEADLGIDTVKQAEIFADLRERYGFEQEEGFRLSDVPTLEALAAYLETRVGGEPEPPTPTPPPAPTPVEPSPPLTPPEVLDAPVVPRAVPKAEDVYGDVGRDRPTGEQGLPGSFRLRRPILVDRAATPSHQTLLDCRVLVLGDSPTAHAVRQEIALRSGTTEGPYNTVVDLSDDPLVAFRQARFLDRDRPTRWITVTRMGGMEPVDGARAWTDGARAGFTKALGREWEECAAKVLDVGPADGDLEVATAVCDELQSGPAAEVFLVDGRRRLVRYRTENIPSRAEPMADPVVLVTGGARGICARIAAELASRGPCRLVLVGRSPVPETAWDIDAEKARIKADLTLRGERATPARIEKELGPKRRANEAVATIDGLRAHPGVRVEYRTCDLADPTAATELGRAVLDAHGRVDVCIHGAGVEESRLLAQKDETAWHRVFDGKAIGGRALIEVLPETTLFVSMGSVAGRYGNPGQVDYAAANDAMARRCLAHPNALHIDWTAWDDVGMASESSMRRILVERGVDLLPAAAGAALLVDLLGSELRGELVVAGRLGDFQGDAGHPLLDRLELDGDTARAYRELSVAGDPWILDHAIEGVPVLPGVVGIELMAAVAAVVRPESTYIGVRDVRFEAPVKVHGDQSVLLVVEAEPAGPSEVRTRLIAVRTLRTGRIQRQEHFSAVVQVGIAAELEPLPSAFLPDETVDSQEIYRRFFHGPIFQVLRNVFGVSADGLISEATVEPANIASHLLTAPLVLESAFQSAGLHQMLTEHTMGLPMGIDEVRFIQPPEPATPFSVTVRKRGRSYDIDVDGLQAPLMRVRGYTMAEKGPLPEGDRFPLPAEERPVAFPPVEEGSASGDGFLAQVARGAASEPIQSWLAPEEIAELAARGTERRQADRRAGRIAAKRALSNLTGVDPLAIRILTAPSGEPIARVPGFPGVRVSVSHRDGHAVAVAVPSGRIGIDLEAVEPRSEGFARTWLLPEERALTGDDALRQTLVWSAKEAVLKALGTGMAIAPRHVRVTAIHGDRLSVTLGGAAMERWKELGRGELSAQWIVDGAGEVCVQVKLAA